ncbi:hypothetical protein OE903_13945 [Bacillus sp. B6(2022)]|nr:hypothetical protein [Bacillus sp. B6(2022)]
MDVYAVFGFFFTFGIFVPYWSIWLVADKNFSPDQAGIIIATGLLTRAMTTFFYFLWQVSIWAWLV